MNKNCTFLLSMSIVSLLLAMLRVTGMAGHISVTVAGLVVMIPLTLSIRKEWKKPALEIILRLMYFVAIVTGGVMMKIQGVAALGMIHKIAALLFTVLLLVLYVPKCKK